MTIPDSNQSDCKKNSYGQPIQHIYHPRIKDSGHRQEEKTGALSDPSNTEIAAELLSPYALEQLSKWLGAGAKKYTPRNWEKGIPFSICVGKLLRHLFKYEQGLQDEDHLAAVGFWWHALSHYEKMIELGLLPKELDDLPKYENISRP